VWDHNHSLELSFPNGNVAEAKAAARRCAAWVDQEAVLERVAGPRDAQVDAFPNGALGREDVLNVRNVQRRQAHAHDRPPTGNVPNQ
jgi:hypothetical protein